MGQRLELQTLFEELLGSTNVYFQPPPNVQMEYPCIVYKRDRITTRFANNTPYRLTNRYMVTVIDRDPDSTIPDAIAKLPMSIFDRHYVANNLNHNIFNLYF